MSNRTDQRLKRLESSLQADQPVILPTIDRVYYERGLQSLHEALASLGYTPFENWQDTIAALRHDLERTK